MGPVAPVGPVAPGRFQMSACDPAGQEWLGLMFSLIWPTAGGLGAQA
jgi:hypothetical protein